jgi:flagellar basal-body rod protein FlgF
MQISASGVLTSMYRLDVHANNLSNLDTVGYKPDVAATRQRPAVAEEDGVGFLPSNALLERLGGGILMAPNRVSFSQGPLEQTGNPLDLAIDGEGFFMLRDEANKSSDRVRLTRDGRFTRDPSGQVVSASSGMPVLDAQNRPIVIPQGPQPTIGTDGVIRQGQIEIARIGVVKVPDQSKLAKIGNGMFRAPAEAFSGRSQSTASVRQGFVEQSGVNEMQALLSATSAARDVETNIGMIQQQDRMLDRAINSLGRVT